MPPNRRQKITVKDLAVEIERLHAVVADLARKEAEDRRVLEESRMVLAAKTATRPPAAKLAKGSQPIPVQPPAEPEAPLLARVAAILQERPRTYEELEAELGEDVGRLGKTFAAARKRGDIADAGTPELPRYVWVVGDDVATPELRAHVERLVRMRPITFAEVVTATGANPNRIKGVLTDLQRQQVDPLRNFGSRSRALWFIPPR